MWESDTASITVSVDNADGSVVYARYSTSASFPVGSTVDLDVVVPIGFGNTTFVVAGLDSDTTYYVEASYDVAYPPAVTEEATFDTLVPSRWSAPGAAVNAWFVPVRVGHTGGCDMGRHTADHRRLWQRPAVDPR